jgi:hypothetical protein
MLTRVSAKTRSRKGARAKTSANAGSKTTSRRAAEPDLRAARDVIIDSMRVLADPAEVSHAYEAETMVSVLLGMAIEAGARDDLLVPQLLRICDELARGKQPHAYPALRTLAVVAPPQARDRAAKSAERIAFAAEQAGSAPPWTRDLGQVTPGSCMLYVDAYQETHVLLCDFSYPDGSRQHGVFAVIDAAWHGAVTKLSIDDSPAKTLRMMEKRARRDDGELRQIPAAQAAALLQAGIDAFLRHGPAPEPDTKNEDFGLKCYSVCLTRHRIAVLAGPDTEPAGADLTTELAARWSPDARAQLAAEFLAAPQARDLQGIVARKAPLLIISACVDQLGCDPLLTGPQLLSRMLLDVLPATLLAPDRFGAEIPPALRAWTRWLADRHELSGRPRRQLMFRLEYLLRKFDQIWRNGSASPVRRYIEDLPDEIASDGQLMFDVIARRTFAVPQPGSRGDGTAETHDGGQARHADDLDAADERDRMLITLIGLSQRGLPQQRFAPYLAVTEQLWTGEPPEMWAAARRMLDAKIPRDKILDRLARDYQREH